MSQNSLRLAVVIPLYNKGPYLAAALEAVKAQTHQPDEILVVDDGLTDGGPEIARSWEPYERVLSSGGSRLGPSRARNVGIEAASADFIAFLDADDLWHTRFLEVAASTLLQSPSSDGVFTPCLKFVDRLPSLISMLPEPVPASQLDFKSFLDKWVSTTYCPASSSTTVFRRSAIIRAGMFNEAYRRGEDKDAFLRFAYEGNVVEVDIPLGFQRLGVPGQETRSIPTMMPPLVYSAAALLEKTTDPGSRRRLEQLINQSIWHYAKINRSRRPFPQSYLDKFRQHLNPWQFLALRCLYALTCIRHGRAF